MTDGQQPPASTLRERMAFAELVLNILCTTVWVFIRKDLGYRTLSPTKLFILAGLLITAAKFSSGSTKPLAGYAIAMLVIGLIIRRRRWNDFRKGRMLHTKNSGSSYLAPFLPLSEYQVKRFVEPLLILGIGLTLALLVSRSLGLWLMFMSGALAATEAQLHQHSLERQFDMHDARCEAEDAADTSSIIETQAEATRKTGLMVYSTALSNDLQQLMARREGLDR